MERKGVKFNRRKKEKGPVHTAPKQCCKQLPYVQQQTQLVEL